MLHSIILQGAKGALPPLAQHFVDVTMRETKRCRFCMQEDSAESAPLSQRPDACCSYDLWPTVLPVLAGFKTAAAACLLPTQLHCIKISHVQKQVMGSQ